MASRSQCLCFVWTSLSIIIRLSSSALRFLFKHLLSQVRAKVSLHGALCRQLQNEQISALQLNKVSSLALIACLVMFFVPDQSDCGSTAIVLRCIRLLRRKMAQPLHYQALHYTALMSLVSVSKLAISAPCVRQISVQEPAQHHHP